MVAFVSCRELALMAAAAALGGAVVAASFAIANPKRAFCRKQRLRLSFWRNVACLLRLPTYPDQMTHLLDSQCSTCSCCSHVFAFPVSKDQNAISRSELCLDNADPKETKLLPEGCIDHMTLVACNEEQKVDPFDPSKRKGYLSWDDYFMAIAFLSAHRSKDPNRQVGACLVSQNRVILGIGYNGFPRGCSDDALPWAKISATGDPLQTKYPYVCHAEVNAILNKNHASAAGQRLYVTMFPCNECAKIIIQAGVAEVVYFRDVTSDYLYTASRRLLSMAGVKLWRHQPTRTQLLLDFK